MHIGPFFQYPSSLYKVRHPLYDWLTNQNLASEVDVLAMEKARNERPFSLFREVNFLLYAGVLILGSGLGILIYKNIDTIGHLALIALLLLAALGCLVYSHLKYPAFTTGKLTPPNLFYPYLVLLGVTLFLLWEGYIEYQYSLFDNYYNIPTLLAASVCFLVAYRFDHEGILSIALATLVATIGLTILPQKWFLGNVDYSEHLFFMGSVMGFLILVVGYLLAKRKLKVHFEPTYANVGGFLMLACLLGLQFRASAPWLALLILPVCFGLFLYARQIKSIGVYIVVILVAYCSFTGFFFEILNSDFWIFGTYYGMASIAAVGFLLLKYKHFLRIAE